MRRVLVGCLVFACRGDPPAKLERSALIGDWEFWCAAKGETCLGKDPSGDHKMFAADGTLEWWDRDHHDTRSTSDWKLEGNILTIAYRNAGASESFPVRLVDRALVMWDAKWKQARIYGRAGERLKLAPSVIATGAPVARTVAGVRYRLAVPAGYRLGSIDPDRERWEPERDGFVYTVIVGRWQGGACPADQAKLQAGGDWGGEHTYGVGTSLCLAGTSLHVSCDAGHTRGYLEKAEEAAALDVCKTLSAERS